MVYFIDGMEIRTRTVAPSDITMPKALKLVLILLTVIFLIEMIFAGMPIRALFHASTGVVFTGLMAWNL